MVMSASRCSYHPEKVAVTTCRRCKRAICLEDKRMYQRTHYKVNVGGEILVGNNPLYDNVKSYKTTNDYCILCYASQKKSKVSGTIAGLVIIIILMIFVFILSTFSLQGNFPDGISFNPGSLPAAYYLIAILIILLVIGEIIKEKLQANKAIDEAVAFKKSLNQNSNYDTSKFDASQKKTFISQISCFECGSMLDVTDMFCPNCGNDTKDELRSVQGS